MRLACSLLASLLFLVPEVSAQISGSWSGTYTAMSTACQPAVPHGGSGHMTVSQNGGTVTGTVSIEIFLFDCRRPAHRPRARRRPRTSPSPGPRTATRSAGRSRQDR